MSNPLQNKNICQLCPTWFHLAFFLKKTIENVNDNCQDMKPIICWSLQFKIDIAVSAEKQIQLRIEVNYFLLRNIFHYFDILYCRLNT